MPDNRKLGDEWIGWNEEDSDTEYNEGKNIFIFFASLTCLLYLFGLALFWYLVMPRFAQFGAIVHGAVFAVFAIILTLSTVLAVFLIALMSTGGKLPLKKTTGRVFYSYLLDGVLKTGKFFGISRDRMGSSFIKVSNDLNKVGKQKINGTELLILLPRCLEKSVRNAINESASQYGCIIAMVSGGEAARRKIFEIKPKTVLGIACERDLLSGIQDTAVHLPVLGIANQRPEGPCKNTTINIDELNSTLASICKKVENNHSQ